MLQKSATPSALILSLVCSACGGGDAPVDAVQAKALCTSAPACLTPDRVSIAPFLGDRKGAVSYTFDDGSPLIDKVISIFDEQALRASFYIIAAKTTPAQWLMWKNAGLTGHEVGSHSMTHLLFNNDDIPEDQLQHEIVDSKKLIGEKIGIYPDTFVFPGNNYAKKAVDMVLQNYIATRFPANTNGSDYEIFYLGQYSKTDQMNLAIEKTIVNRVWTAFAGHSVDTGGYNPIPSIVLREHVKQTATMQDQIWVDTFANVAKYRICRSNAKISMQSSSDQAGVIRVDVSNRPYCNFPLTLIVDGVNPGVAKNYSSQNGETTVGNKMYFNVTPGVDLKVLF